MRNGPIFISFEPFLAMFKFIIFRVRLNSQELSVKCDLTGFFGHALETLVIV